MKKLYRGYVIKTANPTGGKAGKGFNKTSTVQVLNQDNMLIKHFRYQVGDPASYLTAVFMALTYVDELIKKE